MARQRKPKQGDKSKNVDASNAAEDIPEDEKWRIIEQTGLLSKIPKDANRSPPADTQEPDTEICSPFCNEIYNTILFLIPFTSLYVMMEVLAKRQYAQKVTASALLEKVIYGVPFLYLCIFYILRYKHHRYMQPLLATASIASGARLIYIINWEGWQTVLNQCAPLGTLWVLTIALMDLIPAVLALVAVAAFVKWKNLKIVFDP